MDKKSSRTISETRALLTNQAARTVPSPGANGGYFTIKPRPFVFFKWIAMILFFFPVTVFILAIVTDVEKVYAALVSIRLSFGLF